MEHPAPPEQHERQPDVATPDLTSSSARSKDEDSPRTAGGPVIADSSTASRGSTTMRIGNRVNSQPWLRQLAVVLLKNSILLWRRPVTLSIMLLSSIISVLVAGWAAPDIDFGQIPLTPCGTVDDNYIRVLPKIDQYSVPTSYNENWRSGLAVTVITLGPMAQALCCFLVVHNEIQTQMLGVLRGLGLRDSVYWTSWFLPFTFSSFVNSMLGAITAALMPIHVYQNTYIGGIFAALFFLQLALVSSSLFVAALQGTSRGGASLLMLIMLVAPWIPCLYSAIITQSISAKDVVDNYIYQSPAGLFWVNGNTTKPYRFFHHEITERSYAACDDPILTEEEGKFFKTEEERLEVGEDKWFVGCYEIAGLTTSLYSDGNFGTAALFFIPYLHFSTIFGNFLGYTGMPNRSFKNEHASMSPEELAIASLPTPPNTDNGKGTALFAQGSTLKLNSFHDKNYQNQGNSCPAANLTDYFCPYLNDCNAALEPAPAQDSPSVFDMIGYLMSLCAFYFLAAAYWAQVFPGGNGAPQKIFFFLLPTYWCGSKVKETTEEERGRGVVVSNICKKYGEVDAVKDVSIQMEPGTITALLGHNGAGKTTLSHMICCETAATSGDILVYGYSSTHDAYSVRQLVGVCKQDDYLYPNLTAREHLQLFGGLRGVPIDELAEKVQEWLESVDLAVVQDQYSSAFSGGMKRRLSVACSTIGDTPVIVLDEPTTGMDPISRRIVWRHLEAIREGRVILLVSHAMDEAELLADSVAVMKKGALAALGSPLELKAQYGSALQFNVLVPAENVELATKAILDHFRDSAEWVIVDPGAAGTISVNIGQIENLEQDEGVSVEMLATFVDWLESEESGVSEYGFSNSSIEEVFLKVTADSEEQNRNEDTLDVDVCCKSCRPGCLRCCLAGPCSFCSCPKSYHSGEVVEEGSITVPLEGFEADVQQVKASEICSFKPSLNIRSQVQALFTHSMKSTWLGKGSIGTWIWISLLVVGNIILGIFAPGFGNPTIALTYESTAMSLILITITSPLYLDRQYGLFYLMRTQGLLKPSYIFGHSLYAFIISFSIGFLLLLIIYATLFRQPILCDRGASYYDCHFKVGDPPTLIPFAIYWWSDEFQNQTVTLFASPTPGGYGKVFAVGLVFALSAPGAMFSGSHLPGVKFALICLSFLCLVAGIAPMLSFSILPQSMRPSDSETPHPCEAKVCDTNTREFNIDTIGDTGKDFLNCIGLDINRQKNLGSFCIPPVAAILPQYGIFQALASTLYSDIMLTSDPPEYIEQVLMPTIGGGASCSGASCKFPFAQSLYGKNIGWMAFGAVLLFVIGYGQILLFSFPGPRVVKFWHLVSRAFAWLKCKAEKAPAEQHAEPERVLEEVTKESDLVAALIKPLLKLQGPESMEEGDGSQCVIANHAELARENLPPVVMYKLRKVYPSPGGVPPKVALAGMDLQVPRGEVLGLLGKNGAGKTTALKILSISHSASSGIGLIAGFDVSCEEVQVFERLGNCPQFDLVWPGESIQRHLEFFAQLKGLPRKKVIEIALSIATAVGLGAPEIYGRHAGRLSGGMRRRLSIAISLIGAPDVLLLDEPSTGLDPSTRNSIWSLVKSFSTAERSVVITTHAMLEADALCNRIAIVSQGHLKVVATQQHLKDKFGSGYLLQLNLIKSTAEHQGKAMAFVRNRLHNDATLQTKQAKTLHIALPRDLDLRDVFRALYSPASTSEGCINQFLLSQSSLEDVFVAIAE